MILAVEIVEIDDRGPARNGSEIGDVKRNRLGQVDLLLGLRALRPRGATIE
jgi:hypothetical protein